MNKAEVESLLAEELARMPEAARSELCLRLQEPTVEIRSWAYGPGRFECWRVAAEPQTRTCILYLAGAGAFHDRWGFAHSEDDDLGSDAQWFVSLHDAAIAVGWIGAPSGYEVP